MTYVNSREEHSDRTLKKADEATKLVGSSPAPPQPERHAGSRESALRNPLPQPCTQPLAIPLCSLPRSSPLKSLAPYFALTPCRLESTLRPHSWLIAPFLKMHLRSCSLTLTLSLAFACRCCLRPRPCTLFLSCKSVAFANSPLHVNATDVVPLHPCAVAALILAFVCSSPHPCPRRCSPCSSPVNMSCKPALPF
jgi:hypothetical protein